jgi:hypothetical protein
LDFVGAGVVASGTGTTKTITIAGGGGGSIPAFPTYIETVNFASANSATQVITLASTPTTGDVIFVATGNCAYPVTGVVGAGATWWRIDGRYIATGNFTMLDLWMGIVGGSPSTGITVTWAGANTYYGAAVVYQGLSGKIEMVVGWNSADLAIASMSSARSPIAIAAFFSRASGTIVAAGGFTSLTSASVGGDRADLLYLDTSGGINVGLPVSGFSSGNNCLLMALIY